MSYSSLNRSELTRLHERGTPWSAIALVVLVVDFRVEKLHADRDAMLLASGISLLKPSAHVASPCSSLIPFRFPEKQIRFRNSGRRRERNRSLVRRQEPCVDSPRY
jgi:hypothetical protein